MKTRRKSRLFTPFQWWLILLLTTMGLGAVAGIIVLVRGLGVTNLTDLVPWGLWITLDLSAIAISAGAFALCAAVYLLGLKPFQPVARTATFIGVIGYSMAIFALLLDIGRPDRFWHSLVYWNPHSVLWEVTMCVTLYFGVLILETLPILGQAEWMQWLWPWLARRLRDAHHLAPVLAVAGLGLSMLHQSSLGATYGVLKARPIWYRPDLAVLFIASAVAAGASLTVFASTLAAALTPRARVNHDLLDRLSHFIGWWLVVYLYLRFWDMLPMTYTYLPGRSEALQMLTTGMFSFNFWAGEILVGTLFPIVVLLHPGLRAHSMLRLIALAGVVGGMVAFRWDNNMVGQIVVLSYTPQAVVVSYTHYVPSLIEVISGAGIVAYGLMAFTLGARYLPVFSAPHAEAQEHAALTMPAPMPQVSGA